MGSAKTSVCNAVFLGPVRDCGLALDALGCSSRGRRRSYPRWGRSKAWPVRRVWFQCTGDLGDSRHGLSGHAQSAQST
jgi:hypothetical protein